MAVGSVTRQTIGGVRLNEEPRYQIIVPLERLRENRKEAELLLRLGAIANAVLASARAFTSPDGTLSRGRDRVQQLALLASYAVETCRVLDGELGNLAWPLVEQARSGTVRLDSLEIAELKDMLTRRSGFWTNCAVLRDQFTFHVDAKPVGRWMQRLAPNDAYILQTVEGPAFTSCLFDAAGRVLRDALSNQLKDGRFGDQLIRFGFLLPRFVHTLIEQFAIRIGISPTASPEADELDFALTIRNEAPIVIEIRPTRDTWTPFYVGLPAPLARRGTELRFGPREKPIEALPAEATPTKDDGEWWVRQSVHSATPDGGSHFLFCESMPELLIFGAIGGAQRRCVLTEQWGPRRLKNVPSTLPDLSG